MAIKVTYVKDGKSYESEGLNKTIRELGYNGPNKNSKDCMRWMESIGCTSIEVEGSEYQASPSTTKSNKNMSPLEVIVKQYVKFNDTNFEKNKKEKLEELKVKKESTIDKLVSALDMVALKNAKDELVNINLEIEEVKASTFEVTPKAVLAWVKALFDEFEEEKKKVAQEQALAQAQAPQEQAQAQEQATPQEKEEK